MQMVTDDPTLSVYNDYIQRRYERFLKLKGELEFAEGSLLDFAKGYDKFGMHKTGGGILFKEWAPGASALCLVNFT